MAGLDLKGNVQGNYSPVGHTPGAVITQSPNWDGIVSGVTKLGSGIMDSISDAANASLKSAKEAEAQQLKTQSGMYQIQMDDIRHNPNYRNADGTINSAGYEAIRNLNLRNVNLGGSEIRTTQSSIGGDYGASLLAKQTQANIDAQVADEQATDKMYVETAVRVDPSMANAPYDAKVSFGKKQVDMENQLIQLYSAYTNTESEQAKDAIVQNISNTYFKQLTAEQIESFKNSVTDPSAQDVQNIADAFTLLGINIGLHPTQARIIAQDAATRTNSSMAAYRNTITQLTKDETDYLVSSTKNETLKKLSVPALALYSVTNQLDPSTAIDVLGMMDPTKTKFPVETTNDGTGRKIVQGTSKPLMSFLLNKGNKLTASATLAALAPEMMEQLNEGNRAPLAQLTRIPNLAGVVQSGNTDQSFKDGIDSIKSQYATALGEDIRSYASTGIISKWIGNQTMRDTNDMYVTGKGSSDINYVIKEYVRAMDYLGYNPDDIKEVIDSGLSSVGIKAHKGSYTPDELATIASRDIEEFRKAVPEYKAIKEANPFDEFGSNITEFDKAVGDVRRGDMSLNDFRTWLNNKYIEAGVQPTDKDVLSSVGTQRMSTTDKLATESLLKDIQQEPVQMTKAQDVANSPEYKAAVSNIARQTATGKMTQAQAENEYKQMWNKITDVLAEFGGVKSAQAAEVVPMQTAEDANDEAMSYKDQGEVLADEYLQANKDNYVRASEILLNDYEKLSDKEKDSFYKVVNSVTGGPIKTADRLQNLVKDMTKKFQLSDNLVYIEDIANRLPKKEKAKFDKWYDGYFNYYFGSPQD